MIPKNKIRVGIKILPVHTELVTGNTVFCCFPKERADRTRCITCSFFNGEPREVINIDSHYAKLSPIAGCFDLLSFDQISNQFEIVNDYKWRKL